MAVEYSDVGSNSSRAFLVRSVHSGLWSEQQSEAWLRKSCSGEQKSSATGDLPNRLSFQSSRWPFIRWFTWSPVSTTNCSTRGECYKVDNIGRLSTSVAPKLDGCPRCWPRFAWGYHFAGFASCFATWSYLPKWFIITHVWFELGTHKKIPQTLGSSVGHDRSFCEDLRKC